jgi:hypothetical protein
LNIRHPLYSFRAQILGIHSCLLCGDETLQRGGAASLTLCEEYFITAFSRQNADELIKTFEIDVMVTQTQVIDLGSNE